MQATQFREEPIPFVVYNNETRTFEISEEAGDFLKQLKGPLGIISVAGMYRTGKSYLLNRMLLNRSGGFGVGPTINPCTKGIWVWGQPIQGYTPEGDQISVLIIDTEGIGALDEDSNHDVRIFSLAILLSSYFIYNSVGSIDESALSNLSLVINLTKHIHLRSTGISEDVDPEEYSQYFPSFMWVVRDFALQLVDSEGEPLTSKEYLEKALAPQKGFSDGVEQKNRIRRMLKSFFKEMDCTTMIRPLTKEEDLQSLEKMPIDELRQEFQDQVLSLRRKVLHRVKAKTMHDKKLNGQMLYNLALSYVDAMNKGVVPNIESAWTYICKSECQKAQYESYSKFERYFHENFELRCPLFDEELNELYKDARKIALEEFSKVAVGEVQRQFLIELKDKMKQKYKLLKIENEKLSEEQNLMYLQQNYQSIEKRLKNQEYDSILDLVDELKNFQQYYIENGPPGPNRVLVLYEFCYKSLAEASEYFFKGITNELYLQKKIAEDTMHKLQAEIKEMKEDQKKKVDFFESKLRSIETEKAEILAKEQSIRENYQQIAKDKIQLEKEMHDKLEQLKKDMHRQMEEQRQKVAQTEEQAKEYYRQQISSQSEHDKQKALLEQKLEFLEKSLEEAQRKENEMSQELKNQKRDHLSSHKEVQKHYEQQIKEMTAKIDEYSELKFDWDSKYESLLQKYEQESQKWNDSEFHIKKEFTKLKEQNAELVKQNDILKRKYTDEVENLKQSSGDEIQLQNERISELEQQLKHMAEQYEMAKQKWDKDQAIYRQKQEFLELQLRDERLKNEEQRQSHDQMIKNIQSRDRESVIGRQESVKQVAELKEQYTKECQEMEHKFEQVKGRMSQQIEQLQERNNELEISLKIQIGDYQQELVNLREQLKIAEEQQSRSQDAIKCLDSQKIKMLEETEQRHKERQIELEAEIEEKTREFELTIKELQEKSENQLVQLRNFYELERERLEKRIQEEKDRAQKRYNHMVEDYEMKLREEQQLREEDINNLEMEMRSKEAHMNDIIQQIEHDNSLKSQQLDGLEKYLAETKEALNKLTSQSSSALEIQQDKFNDERKELIAKYDKFTHDLAQKEKKITTLENQKESLMIQMGSKDSIIADLRNGNQSEKSELQDKIEQLRAKNQEILDDLTSRKIEYERDKALKTQQLQFQEQRIAELSKQLEDTIRRYDERLKQEREDMLADMQEKVSRITHEKEASDLKYEQKRKALKDLESNIYKQTAQMEKEKAVLQEKYINLENQQRELILNYENENNRLKEVNGQLSAMMNNDKQAIHDEVEKWRSQFLEIERQYQDLNNNYDKDKALWEGKFKFLEQQRDTAKKDFEDAQRKFTMTVEQLQKAQSENKNKTEMTQTTMIQQLESKYQQRIKEIQENQQQLHSELTQKNKQLERENKLLSDKLEISERSKATEQGGLEKKVEKLYEERQRLSDELDTVKNERDSKFQEYQRLLDQERENYKSKLRDAEGKGSRKEAAQTEMLLNFEKERAKWEHEKNYLVSQKEDATENSQRLEKRVEQLLRENEKLKNDVRNSRKNMYQASGATSSYLAANVGANILGNIKNQNQGSSSYGMYRAGGVKEMGTAGDTQRLGGFSMMKENSNKMEGTGLLRQSVNLAGLSSGAVNNFNMHGGVFDSSILKSNVLSAGSSSQKSGDERSCMTSSPEDKMRGMGSNGDRE